MTPTYTEKIVCLELCITEGNAAIVRSIITDVREREEIRQANRAEIAATVRDRFALTTPAQVEQAQAA